MDFDAAQLTALSAVITHGSFDAAAAALRVTPSAISQRIRALETATRRVLVVRSRPVRITEAGVPVLRLARQYAALSADTARELSLTEQMVLPLAVNADSLASWVLPALAPLADEIGFEFHRADQERTVDLLRDGTVMGAITSEALAVQGCTVTPLGFMRYRPYAAPAFVDRWFADDNDIASWERAPMIEFDATDELQRRFLAVKAPNAHPPRRRVPGSHEFREAVRLGYGWGMVPTMQAAALNDEIVVLDATEVVDVRLYWQQWGIRSPALDKTTDALIAAGRALR